MGYNGNHYSILHTCNKNANIFLSVSAAIHFQKASFPPSVIGSGPKVFTAHLKIKVVWLSFAPRSLWSTGIDFYVTRPGLKLVKTQACKIPLQNFEARYTKHRQAFCRTPASVNARVIRGCDEETCLECVLSSYFLLFERCLFGKVFSFIVWGSGLLHQAKRSLARSPIISFHGLLGTAFTSAHPRSVEGRKSTFIYLAR